MCIRDRCTALASIRQSPLSNLDYSPYYLVHGRDPIIPAQIMANHLDTRVTNSSDGNKVMSEIEKLKLAMDNVKVKQLENHERNKKYYDRKLLRQPLAEGDCPTRKKGIAKTLFRVEFTG